MDIGKNLKNSGKKFISKIVLQTDTIKIPDESQYAEEIEIQNKEVGFGEATPETQKKLDETIIYETKEEKK